MNHDLVLSGATPEVLSSYLKALAVHRLVAEQLDREALSYWDDDGRFHLVSSADRDALLDFFVERYSPTPIVTPWNGGSGFHPGDQRAGIDAILADSSARFAAYRETIAACTALLGRLGITEKPRDEQKQRLLEQARARLPDGAVRWLDAVYVVGDSPMFPPILGTGGNDGRLDFANNFMQRLAELLLVPARRRRSTEAGARDKLRASLFGEPVGGVYQEAAVGQFSPALAGGPNMSHGLGAESRVNAWDYVLALEGVLLFAGAAVRRLDSQEHGKASFPFHVATSAVGYGSASGADAVRENNRAELWLPCWPAQAGIAELTALFGEGRLDLGRRRALSGLDAARALATLGVDRGIDRFERIAILKRNGLSFLATAQGSLDVRAVPDVELLGELDALLTAVLRLDNPPQAVSTAARVLQTTMFDACRAGGRLTAVLAAAGALMRAIGRSPKARERIRPLRPLSAAWRTAADDGSTEMRLAWAVASWRGIRSALLPLDDAGRWAEAARPIWTDRSPMDNIVAIARRRLLGAERTQGHVPLDGTSTLTGADLTRLLQGEVDGRRFADLLFGAAFVAWAEGAAPARTEAQSGAPHDAVFALLRAITSPHFLAVEGRHPSPRVVTAILARIGAGDLQGAIEIAERRLRASERSPRVTLRARGPRDLSTLAAALVVPLPLRLENSLLAQIIVPPSQETHG
ncbi:MAG: type I-U CRISPR-associated protein Csx17 [Byssovorax sp.]